MGGSSHNGCEDDVHHTLDIPGHLVVPEAQHFPTLCLQIRGARSVAGGLLTVVAAVQFDGDPRFATRNIDDEMADDQLAREAWPVRP